MSEGMARKRPDEVSLVGWGSVLLGASWLLWLLLARWGVTLDLIRAGTGDADAALRLGQQGLAGARVFFAVPGGLAELALAVTWAVAGIALLGRRPFARRAALLACAAAVAVEALSTLLRVFFLTVPDQPVRLGPVIVNGLVTLGALGLWGGLSLPAIDAVYAGPLADGPAAESGVGG
jgi:hypothetical protein